MEHIFVPITSPWNSCSRTQARRKNQTHTHSVLNSILSPNTHTALMMLATWNHLSLGVCLIRIRIKTYSSSLAVTCSRFKRRFPSKHTLSPPAAMFTTIPMSRSPSDTPKAQPHTRQHPTASRTPSLTFQQSTLHG